MVGAPRIANLASGGELSRQEVEAAGRDRVLALGPFFDYQRTAAIYVRRLVLSVPCLTSGKRSRDMAKAHNSVSVCGSGMRRLEQSRE